MMIDVLAKALWHELMRLDGIERHLWRRFLLRKIIHLVPENLRPVPDGLSPRYIEIGRLLNQKSLDTRLCAGSDAFSPFLVTADVLVEDEISLALLNEQKLLAIATAQ